MSFLQWIEVIAACLGVAYAICEMRASMWLWVWGVLLPLFYIFISFKSQVYTNIPLNVYYLVSCIIGWINWQRRCSESIHRPQIHHAARRVCWNALLIALFLAAALGFLLDAYSSSLYPYLDGAAGAAGLVGMYFLIRAQLESWYFWLVSNAFYAGLYALQGFVITALFFVFYTLIALCGLWHWSKLAAQDHA